MAVLTRSALESSPLADLHEIASELGIDGFRRLRKADLVDSILSRQDPDGLAAAEAAEVTEATLDAEATLDTEAADDDGTEVVARARATAKAEEEGEEEAKEAAPPAAEATTEGVVDLRGNGSGFLRVSPPDPSDGDVYISAAQVRRCELVDGDTVTGPVRPPRRSERYPSLVRVETVNGAPADQVSSGTRYDELPVTYPDSRFALSGEDPTVKAIEWLTPFGRGSRVTITGPARSGKTEALSRLAAALESIEGTQVSLVLTGVRPEEIAAWKGGSLDPAASLTFAAGADAQDQAVEHAIEQARRVASRGGDAVVLI